MLRSLFFATLIVFSVVQAADISGYMHNYKAVLVENNKYILDQNALNLKFKHTEDKYSFYINPYLYNYPHSALTEIDLRELYLDFNADNYDVRIGKQQIVWGKGDGVFITDIVSPKDMRNFLLPDFEEIRLGVNGIKFDYYLENNKSLELVWLSEFKPNRLPEEDSIWLVEPSFPMTINKDTSRQNVDYTFQNSELFVKYSVLSSVIDYELMAGYCWDDEPVMHREIKTPGVMTIYPEHHRLTVKGGSFSAPIGGFILRGEGAYYSGKHFSIEDQAYDEFVVAKDYLNTLLGIDFVLYDIKLSTQYLQKEIVGYEASMLNNYQVNNTVTFLINKEFLDETLTLDILLYHGVNEGDELIRPKITYDFNDSLELIAGANIFYGQNGNLLQEFGKYADNDNAFVKIKYNF